jgi:hypothetical protein
MNSKEETDALFHAFAKAIDQAWLKTYEVGFAEAVREYRQVEADFAARAPDDEFFVTETRRRIAESILMAAHSHVPPFEECRNAWKDLLCLGFSTLYTRSLMTGFYADCCLYNDQFDAGLAVVEPLIAEFEQQLDTITGSTTFCHQQLASLKKLREGLIAFQTSGAEGAAWVDRRDAEYDARDIHWMKRDGRNRELDIALDRAMDSIANASWSRSWAETAHDYRQLEADFVARLQDSDEFFVSEARRRIRCAILMGADKHHEPFEVCRDLWNELLSFDFTNILQKCAIAWFYADSCVFNHQPEAGLAVVEPLLAELQRQVDTGTDEETLQEYQDALARLEKLRDELKALSE